MITLDQIETAARATHLTVAGAFHPGPEHNAPKGTQTLALLAPFEPGFWQAFQTAPEWIDGQPDPMDRWSTRTISALAAKLNATPIFPFGGPPWHPFIRWAQATGRIHKSPVTLLLHDAQGLMISFRGALALRDAVELPAPPLSPCLTCVRSPCETACPVNALTENGYDTDACHRYLNTPGGTDCLDNGCRARRSCPVSASFDRQPAQSAYHMAQFHPA